MNTLTKIHRLMIVKENKAQDNYEDLWEAFYKNKIKILEEVKEELKEKN